MPLAGAVQTGRVAAAEFSHAYAQLRAKPQRRARSFLLLK
jgi:hypothetical protein